MPGFRRPARREEPDDRELLERMGRGDESALELLYSRYAGLLFTLVLRIVGDRELAREVLQDTFLRAWDGGETYDARRGRVSWWLMGIARNRGIDLLRSRSHQSRLRERESIPPGTEDRMQTDSVDAAVLRREVMNALQELTAVQRRMIELAYYGGLTQTEIAQELSEPLGTVKSRTRDAMNRLRAALSSLRPGHGGLAPGG
jgi:RNA polymerase sigma-70 factor, ECF subfamily